MMGEWKDYIIFLFGVHVDFETARSKKEAVKLYVEKCIERYKDKFGSEPTDDMLKNVYENTEVISLSDNDKLLKP